MHHIILCKNSSLFRLRLLVKEATKDWLEVLIPSYSDFLSQISFLHTALEVKIFYVFWFW